MGPIREPEPATNCTGSICSEGDDNSQNPPLCLHSPTSDGAGLELPIDHFRLLGVSPTTDAQAVLHSLQLRIDRVPDQGFTQDTLLAREELLRSSADLLIDSERRAAYEADLTTLAARDDDVLPALDVPTSREVGGLLLLLEAGQPLECFELASRALQPPQAPALGSGREADLALLAGLACLAGCTELHQQRHYEQAARVLRQGLRLLQRMGQQPAIRQQISDALRGLRPYQVLDLLSRELGHAAERVEGLALLEELVRERGGLEADSDTGLSAADFQTFFKQIRGYLTVQEQVDLFGRWADDYPDAHSLAAIALTASGFAQRKPERIREALGRLETTGDGGQLPLRACLQLLLGNVPAALANFEAGADAKLRRWAAQQGGEPLAQLCAYCRDWLNRDVLLGYRDLEADADLEAYFADRDVQAWVERHETPSSQPRSPRGTAAAATPPRRGPGGGAPDPNAGRLDPSNPFAPWSPQIDFAADLDPDKDQVGWPPDPGSGETQPRARGTRPMPGLPSPLEGLRRQLMDHPRRLWMAGGAGTGLLLLAVAIGLQVCRPAPTPLVVQPRSPVSPATAPSPNPSAAANPSVASAPPVLPLTAEAPSEAQLRTLLEAWLQAKAAVLAGREPDQPLDRLAGANQLERLRRERAEDQATSTTQAIDARVEEFAIAEREGSRVAATVRLAYRDRRLDAAGQPVGQASTLRLTNRYVFGRGADGIWRLVSFRRA